MRGTFVAPDGVELYFEDSGGDGPPLFYIYGLGCSIRHWKYPMAHLGARGYRQIWMDFRGHGRSKMNARDRLSIRQIVGDLRALCAFREVEAATFLGQSMGGTIALQLAHDAPELVKSLVLLASPARDPARDFKLQPLSRWVWNGMIGLNRVMPALMPAVTGAFAPHGGKNPVAMALAIEVIRWQGFNPELAKSEDIEEYVGKVLEVNPKLFFDMAEDLATFDVAKLPRVIDCPTLIIAGAKDQIVPLAETWRLAKLLPAAEVAIIDHGSHCPHFDDPGLVCRRLETFLRVHFQRS